MIEITPYLDRNKNVPLYIQLYEYIKNEIQIGTIKVGEKLPSKRSLAKHLGISQNTVISSYEQLCAEGYLESKQRKGIFVAMIEHDLFETTKNTVELNKNSRQKDSHKYKIDFGLGNIDLDYFPYALWKKISMSSLAPDQSDLFLNGDAQGEECLRKEISMYIFQSRGVKCLPEQIVIGAGTQFLLLLLYKLIGKEYDYAIEDPGFYKARIALKDEGAIVHPISLDDEGINIKQLKKSAARVVYVTPSHQFPYGMVMSISRRMELLKWVEEIDGYIIEDDFDSEFRYKGNPIPSLKSLDSNERVIYTGTFSKSLIPSIRLSFLVLPQRLLQEYNEHYTIYNQTVSRFHQYTLYKFMKDGYWSSHLNKMRTLYRKKQKLLLSAINKYMGKNVEVIGFKSGLHILLCVKNGMSEDELIQSARKLDIKVCPISIYYSLYENNLPCKIILGFSGVKETQIDEGIKLLKNAWLI